MIDGDLTHLDSGGAARMVDVGSKPVLRREAIASGRITMASTTVDRLLIGDLPKGEAISVARIAGIQAAKACDRLIPLCHALQLSAVSVDFARDGETSLAITAKASTNAVTGVEMEALTAVAVAGLTLYDMVKAIDKSVVISEIMLEEKTKVALDQ